MQSAIDLRRQPADKLHEIDLAAGRPADVPEIRTQTPERSPHPLPRGNANTRLNAAVGELRLTQRIESRGGVFAGAVVAIERLFGPADRDQQMAFAVGGGIGGIIRVILPFLVAPARHPLVATVTSLEIPLGRVR